MSNANPPSCAVLEVDLKTEADAVLNRQAESDSQYDLKHMKCSEEQKPIKVSDYAFQPDCCITLDDDSDEDITFLGTFSTSSSALSKNPQKLNGTEESNTNWKQEDVNHCVTDSGYKDTCKSHDITGNKERSANVEITSLIKVNVNSSPTSLEEKSSSNSSITPSKGILQNDYPNCDRVNQGLLNSNGNRTNSSQYTIPELCPSPEISPPDKNTSGNIGPTLAVTSTNLLPNIKNSGNDLSSLVSNACPQEKNTSSRHEVENINVLQNKSSSSRHEVETLRVLQDRSASSRHIVINKNVPQESRSSIDKVENINVPQERSISSSSVFCNESSTLQGLSGNSNVDCRDKDSAIINNNPNFKTGTQKTFGSEIKQQVRYVTLPAKFISGKVTTNNNTKKVFKFVHSSFPGNKQVKGTPVLMGGLPCTVGNKTQNSVGSMVQVSDIYMNEPPKNVNVQAAAGIPIVKFKQLDFKNSPINPTKSNRTNNYKKVEPPSMLLLNNKVIKLKGFKQQAKSCDIQKGNQPPVSDKSVTNEGCKTNGSSKSVASKLTQTHIYSCFYRNSNLYTFVNDDGQRVELVPLAKKLIPNPPLKGKRISNPPLETNVGSPLSSLDDEFDTYLEDEISVIDPPEAPNHLISECNPFQNNITLKTGHEAPNHPISKCNPSQNNVTSQTGHEESCGPVQPQIPFNNHQPLNTFQQVLYTELGIYNPESKSITDQSVTQTNSYNNQTRFFQNSSTYQNGYSNTNTVYNTELQMFVPTSQKARSQTESKQPAIAKPDVQSTTSNTNLVVEAFSKLLEDINTCLHDDALGNTPLHQAVISNDLTKLKSQCIVLKTIGSNLNHLNLTHETALTLAVKVAVDINDFEAVSILISEGADQCIVDQDGDTPLHYAVKHGCEPVVRVLLTADDADKVTQKFNYEGFTPLHIAAMEGHDDIIKQLVGTNIDVNVKDRKNGRTAYFLAVKEKRWPTAELLKIFGADVQEPNFSDQTPIVGADAGIATVNFASQVLPPVHNTHEQSVYGMPSGHTEINLSPVHANKIREPLHSQFTTSDQSLDNFGNNKVFHNQILSQIFNDDGLEIIQSDVVGKGETFDANELYNKYVKIAPKSDSDVQLQRLETKASNLAETFHANELFNKYVKIAPKRDSDVQLQRLETKASNLNANKKKLTIPGQKKNTSSKSSIMHPADNRSSTKNQNSESFTLSSDALSQIHNPSPLKGVSSSESHHENRKMIHGCNKSDKLQQEISINNHSVTYNKEVLSSTNIIAQKHTLNSKDNKQKCGNEQNQNELKTNFGVKESPKSMCVAFQDKETRMIRLKPVESSGIKKQPTIQNNQTQGLTSEHSVLKHLTKDIQETSQSPSKVDESNTPFLYTDNLDAEKRKSVEVKQSVNPIIYPSFAHHTKKNDQNITLSCGERSNKLLQNSQLPTKCQENIQLSSEVTSPNSINTNSVHEKKPFKHIRHPSSSHPTKKNKSILLSSGIKPPLGESSNVLQRNPNLPKESQEKEIQKSSDIINHNSAKEKCETAKQPENPIIHSSKFHLTKNDQDIPQSLAHKVTLEETTNKLSRSLNMSKERKEREIENSSDVINISVKKKVEGAKQLKDPTSHSSKLHLTETVQDIPSSSGSKVAFGEKNKKLLKSPNLSKEKQEKEIQKSSDIISPVSVKKKSEEAKQLENPISHLLNNLTKNNINTSSSQDSKIILGEGCMEITVRNQENVRSSEVGKPNTNEKDSVGVKELISHTFKSILTKNCQNTPIAALEHRVASKERSHEAIRKSECNSEIKKNFITISKYSKEPPPLVYIQSEKQCGNGFPDFETPDSKITYGSDDDCSEKNNIDIDLGNIEDVIIGNDSLLSNSVLCINTDTTDSIGPINEVSHKTTTLGSTSENKYIQISYDTLLDDVVKNKKEENISSKETNTKHFSSRKRKKLDSEVLKTNTQNKKEQNSDRTKMLQQPISTDLCHKTRLTSSPLKVGSSVELNVVNKELPSLAVRIKKVKKDKKSPAFNSESLETNSTNTSKTPHTNVEPVGSSVDSFENSESTSLGLSGSEGVIDIPENTEAKSHLEDVVKKKKEENISSQKTNTKHCSSRKRKKLDSEVLKTNTQNKKEQNSDRTKMLQQPISTDLCPKTRLTSSPLKVGSSVELNVVNKELPSLAVLIKKVKKVQKSPAFNSESLETNSTNTSKTPHTNVEPVGSSVDSFENSESTSLGLSGSEGVIDIPENTEAKRTLRKSLSTESKLSATAVNNSTNLVNCIRRRLVRIVTLSNVSDEKSRTVPGLTENEKIPQKQRRQNCKSPSTDSESNVPKQVSSLSYLSDSNTCETQSQDHRNTRRKRSLDLNEQKKTQTTEKKRVCNNNPVTKIEKGNNTPENISRSTKIPKKKKNSNV